MIVVSVWHRLMIWLHNEVLIGIPLLYLLYLSDFLILLIHLLLYLKLRVILGGNINLVVVLKLINYKTPFSSTWQIWLLVHFSHWYGNSLFEIRHHISLILYLSTLALLPLFDFLGLITFRILRPLMRHRKNRTFSPFTT